MTIMLVSASMYQIYVKRRIDNMFFNVAGKTCNNCEYLAYSGDEVYTCVKNLSERDRLNHPEYGDIIEIDVDRACEDYEAYIPEQDDYDDYIDRLIG